MSAVSAFELQPDHAEARQLEPGTRVIGTTISTADVAPRDRREWMNEVLRREYTRAEVTPPADGNLFNEMTLYPWDAMRLDVIRSNAISINRYAYEPHHASQDTYLAVVLLSGNYLLEQNGREVFLQPGDMTIYDSTLPHRIHCSREFSKLLVSIPRSMLRSRLAGVEHCTAVRIPGDQGIGAITASLVHNTARQAPTLNQTIFTALAENSLDLLTLSLASIRPQNYTLSRSRSLSLARVKDFVERHLQDPTLDTPQVAAGTGLSARYINDLFKDEDTSLMRHVWQRRLEHCRQDMLNPLLNGHRISEIALRWGFNDLSHFSRAFRQRFGCAPRECSLVSKFDESGRYITKANY